MRANRLEDVLEIIKEKITPLPVVNKPLKEAYNCILGETAHASMDQPPFPRSPLDGYAFKAKDTQGASQDEPAVLKLADNCFAGTPSENVIRDGHAIRIMTGGMIPEGADCVIMQEKTDAEKGLLKVYQQMKPFENYCHKGEDYKAGQVLAEKGMKIDAAVIAVLASSGYINVQCIPKVRAAILSTGDELRRPGSPLPAGCIYDSNEYYLHARMQDFGVECKCMDSAEDQIDDLFLKVKSALEDTDLLITTGGISVGEKDLVPNVLRMMGAQIVFQGIAMKPGMPTLMAIADGKVILGLSGNPFSAVVSFEVLIKHILNAMYGAEAFKTEELTAVLENSFPKRSKARRFIRGRYADGKVLIPAAQGNGQLSSMVGCNCLVDIPAGSEAVEKGKTVNIRML